MRMRTTVASVSAGIWRTASWLGISVPSPRTWRSMDPRFTVSVHTVPRSTEGAAGFSRETANRGRDHEHHHNRQQDDLAAALLTFEFWTSDIHRETNGHPADHTVIDDQVTETSRDTVPLPLSHEAPTVPYWTGVSGNGQLWTPKYWGDLRSAGWKPSIGWGSGDGGNFRSQDYG